MAFSRPPIASWLRLMHRQCWSLSTQRIQWDFQQVESPCSSGCAGANWAKQCSGNVVGPDMQMTVVLHSHRWLETWPFSDWRKP
eukprot:4208732-Amphidinium_carterae.1